MCIKRCVVKWWSFIVLKTSDFLTKRKFRDMEKISLKIVSLESHQKFNESYLIYICIYIYVFIYILDIYIYIYIVNNFLLM